MTDFEAVRRSLLFTLGGLGAYQLLQPLTASGASVSAEAAVLAPGEGEHLVHFRDGGNIFIKAGTATGSSNVAFGTQQVMKGSGIPVHRHPQMDESFYILQGSGVVTLNDVPHPFEAGSTAFIPRNTWHGFSNPDHELLLLWIVTPAGLDGFFRETCNPPGVAPKKFTREQIREIALKYGTEFR